MESAITKVGIIGAYAEVCKSLSEEEFCRRSPFPFLLHSAETGPLVPTDATRGVTIDRLVLDDPQQRGGLDRTQDASYTVFVLQPQDPGAKRLTVGCSSICDVQINDESVSKQHAAFARDQEGYSVQDLDSAAGTQVDDEVLEPGRAQRLQSGSRITLGLVDLVFLPPGDFYHFVRRFFRMPA